MLASIVIPCLNERKTIVDVLKDAHRNARQVFGKDFEIIVADNGSTDGTLKQVKKFAKARVINVPLRGYGAALHWGITNAKGKYVIFADADQSYPFLNLEKFSKLLNKNPDLILGSRLKGQIESGAMPFTHRFLGTPVLTALIRWIYHIPTSDCNSGMRMVKKSFYNSLHMRNSGMEWASELLLKTALKNGKYLEVPIEFKKDKRNKPPHLSSWADGWRHLKAIVLLKPKIILIVALVATLISFFVYQYNFGLTILLITLGLVLGLSYGVLSLISLAVENKSDIIAKTLVQFKLVPITFLFLLLCTIFVVFLPNKHLGTRLLLCGVIGIVTMWIFFVETIKTHLINRLTSK